MKKYIYKQTKLFILIAAAVCAFGANEAARAQARTCQKPVTFARLKVNLENKSFNTKQIVQTINECGADFVLTPPLEAQLVAAGARPQVLEAIRNNYRAVAQNGNSGGGSSKSYSGAAIQKAKLLAVVKNKSLGNGAMVDAIEKNGVDFQVTPAVERELLAAGASPSVVAAAKTNFRSAGGASSKGGTNTAGGGSPLTKDAVVSLLQNGAADAQVQSSVKARGVNFKMTAQTAQEIKSAGGSPLLIKLLGLAYVAPSANSGGGNSSSNSAKVETTYEDLIEQAVETFNADVNAKQPVGSPGRLKAIEILKNALAIEAANPAAYQQLGYMTLYGTDKNFAQAEQYFAKAIALGGNAVIRVFHDHNGLFTEVCQGSLYIAKDGVRFESDDNKHTFNTTDANIQKVSMNSGFKRAFQNKAGSFKIVLKSGDSESEKYSFAPLTNSSEESKMVIRLIGKN